MNRPSRLSIIAIIGPGLLVAATGVGAGDLATGAIVGSKLGVAVLWAVVLGAILKFVLTEGLARWQLVTRDTILEGNCAAFWSLGAVGFFDLSHYLELHGGVRVNECMRSNGSRNSADLWW